MAGLETVLQILPLVQQGVGLISNVVGTETAFRDQRAGQDQALRQLQERQREDQRQSAEDAALQRDKISADADAAARKRRSALRRAVARQRASFGGSGISSTGGSAEAVLLGLFEETDADREERKKLDTLRLGVIDQNIDQQRRLNVIQRTQLQQSRNIGRLSAQASRGTGLFNTGVGVLNSLF